MSVLFQSKAFRYIYFQCIFCSIGKSEASLSPTKACVCFEVFLSPNFGSQMMKGTKSQGKALPVICIWQPCGQLQTWGTKTQTRIQHGGRSSTSACEENLVKKSHGNEGKGNFTYLDTLKS